MAVIKTIDLVGVSSESWRDAAHQALAEAAKTIRGIEGMDVLGTSATVKDNAITEYLTHVQIRFRLERSRPQSSISRPRRRRIRRSSPPNTR
jgi:flavin-binding protein dodecin